MAVVSVDDLTIAYGNHTVIDHLSFSINEGDFLVVVGENGVGKTTLVRSMLGFLKPKSGTITIPQSTRLGYVPQFRNIDEEYPLSIRDFVALNTKPRLLPWLTKSERNRVEQMIRENNLTKIAERPLGLASGGEKQRAYLAQALLPNPNLLILDESTASLDNEMKYELLDLVTRFQQKGLSVMFITHDWDLAEQYGTRFLYLSPGSYSTGPINELPSPIKGDKKWTEGSALYSHWCCWRCCSVRGARWQPRRCSRTTGVMRISISIPNASGESIYARRAAHTTITATGIMNTSPTGYRTPAEALPARRLVRAACGTGHPSRPGSRR